MMNHDKLTVAACKLRDLTIERNIAHLKSQIAQQEASELHNRSRKLDHEVMLAAGDLSRAAIDDVPEIFMTNIGGDNEAAKQMIAKLVVLRGRKEYHPPAITTVKIPEDVKLDLIKNDVEFSTSIGFVLDEKNKKIDEYMAKRIADHMAGVAFIGADEETKKRPVLTIGCHCPEGKCEHEQPMMLTEEDTSPWDSTIE